MSTAFSSFDNNKVDVKTNNETKELNVVLDKVKNILSLLNKINENSDEVCNDLKILLESLTFEISEINDQLNDLNNYKVDSLFDKKIIENSNDFITKFIDSLNDRISKSFNIEEIIGRQLKIVSASPEVTQQMNKIALLLKNTFNNNAITDLEKFISGISDNVDSNGIKEIIDNVEACTISSENIKKFADEINKSNFSENNIEEYTSFNSKMLTEDLNSFADSLNEVDNNLRQLYKDLNNGEIVNEFANISSAIEQIKNNANVVKKNTKLDNKQDNGEIENLSLLTKKMLEMLSTISNNNSKSGNINTYDNFKKPINNLFGISSNTINNQIFLMKKYGVNNMNDSYINETNRMQEVVNTLSNTIDKTFAVMNGSISNILKNEAEALSGKFNNTNVGNSNINAVISSSHINKIKDFGKLKYSERISDLIENYGKTDSSIYNKFTGNFLDNKDNFKESNDDLKRKIVLSSSVLSDIRDKARKQNKTGNESELTALLDKVSLIAEEIGHSQIDTMSQINLSKGQYKFLNNNDKKIVDSSLKLSNSSIRSISSTIIAIETIDKNNKSLKDLKSMRSQLLDINNEISNNKESTYSMFNSINKMFKNSNKIINFIGAGFGIMGLSMIMPTMNNALGFVSGSFDRYAENGKLKYNVSKSDVYMGNNVSESNNKDIVYGLGKQYFNLTNGMIDFSEPSNFYGSISKNVGGHYNEGSTSAKNDMKKMTMGLFSTAKLYDINDSVMTNAIKTFYKDLNMSASDSITTFQSLCQDAINSNTPVEKYVNTVTELASSLREIGVNGNVVINLSRTLTKSGFRLEDASSLISDTANAGVKMGDNWSRSAFYGMMSGQSGDIWNNIESGMLSHDENSKPVDGYYQNMTDRLFTESGMMMGIGGGNNSLGISLLMQNLKQQGYSQKSASTIASLAKDGKLSEMKKMMMNEDSLNGPTALPDSTNEFNKSLAISASQLAETTKIQSDYKSSMNDMGILIDNNLSAPMKKMRVWIDKLMDKFVKLVDKIMKSMMSAYNTEIFQKISNFAVDNPIKTMIGIMGVAGIGKGLGSIALKKGFSYLTSSSSLISKVENKNINNIFSGFSKTKNMKILAALLAGGATLAVASKVFANSSNDSGNEVNKTLKNGSFKAQIINYEESKKWLLPIIGGSIGVLSVAKLLKLYNKKYGNKKLKMFSGKIKGGIMSSLLYATAFDLYDSYGENNSRSAANHMSNIISDTGGMFVGKKIGEGLGTIVKPGIGTKTGGIIGEIVGGAASDYFKKATGIAKEEDIVDQYKRDSNMIANEYKINVNETIDSNSEMSKIMKQSLVNHGVYVGDLNEDQKRFWLKLFNEYILMYNDINKAALAASRGLKHYSGKDHIFRNPNGSWSMDDAGKYEIYGKVSNDWDNDDITKAKWFEKRSDEQKSEADNIDDIYGKQAGKTEAYKYNLIANYYYHSNDATSEEYWQNLKNELHGEADRDDYEGQIMKSLYHDFVLNKLKKLDNSSSFNLNNASADDAKMFSKYLAEIYVEKEKSSYVETTGWEDVQDAIKNNNASGISGGQVDIFKDSGVTIDQLDQRLAGTNLEGTGSQIYRIAKQYGLDPRFFCAMLLHEGGSRNNPGNVENYSSGSRFGDFSSLEKGLEMSAKSWVGAAKAANSSDLAQACEIYAPSSDGNSDYATNTVQIMNEIDGPAVGYGNHAHNYGGKGTFRISENDHPDYDGMTDSTKSFMNALTSKFYDKTGVIVTMTSGYRPGDTGSRHAEGRAFDVVADEFEGEDGEKLRKIYGEIAAELGGTPLDEYESENAHYARGGGNFHVTAPESFNGATADGGYSPLQYQEQKPLSVKEQFNKGIKDYNNLVESLGGKSIQGNIVNGMYVDQNNEFKNIDTIKKEIEDQTKNSANNLFAQNDRVSYEQSTSNKNNEDMSNTISNAQNNGDENGILKNNHFNEIIKEVRDIALKYMDNPKIEMNCTLG